MRVMSSADDVTEIARDDAGGQNADMTEIACDDDSDDMDKMLI